VVLRLPKPTRANQFFPLSWAWLKAAAMPRNVDTRSDRWQNSEHVSRRIPTRDPLNKRRNRVHTLQTAWSVCSANWFDRHRAVELTGASPVSAILGAGLTAIRPLDLLVRRIIVATLKIDFTPVFTVSE